MSHQPKLISRIERRLTQWTGHPIASLIAAGTVLVWVITGPIFKFSDTWQLVINTGTSVVTFLMVFIIQNSQNRDTAALQLKLDELIRSHRGAHNALLDLEELEQKDLELLRKRYEQLAQKSKDDLQQGLRHRRRAPKETDGPH